MTNIFKFAGLLFMILTAASSLAENTPHPHPRVLIETSEGNITLELDRTKAPATVENFLQYVTDGFYNGTIYHRVIKDFMIQGGGYTVDFKNKETRAPIKNEADNGLSNRRGTIAMARTSDPHSATAQFFINTVNNRFLDYTSQTQKGWGYTVFGKVILGIDTVQRIQSLPTGPGGILPRDVPNPLVIIKKVSLISGDTPAS